MKTVEQHGNDKLCYIKQNAMLYLGEVGYSLKSKAQKKLEIQGIFLREEGMVWNIYDT